MDLEKELLKKQSLVQCNRIIKWIGDDETRYGSLIKLFFKGTTDLHNMLRGP
jgi:hypothetical protein